MSQRGDPAAAGPGPIVVVLDRGGAASGSGPELLTAAKQVTEARGGRVIALSLGSSVPADTAVAFQFGADEALVALAPWLSDFNPDAQVSAIAETCASLRPACVLLSHGAESWEVAPRLAVHLGTGLITDCVSLSVSPSGGTIVGTRPCFSGKALSEWKLSGEGPGIVTLRRQSVVAGEPDPDRSGEVSRLELTGRPEIRTRTLRRIGSPEGELRIEDADIVVGVGRGIGTSEEFQSYFVDGLANVIGAACGGSRGAVDLGIIPPELQIGLTGRVVSPKLYIAVGLSGSPQHMAGCSGARNIVAINTDPQAPIFGYAHHGVVGDYRKVVPSITDRLRELAAES